MFFHKSLLGKGGHCWRETELRLGALGAPLFRTYTATLVLGAGYNHCNIGAQRNLCHARSLGRWQWKEHRIPNLGLCRGEHPASVVQVAGSQSWLAWECIGMGPSQSTWFTALTASQPWSVFVRLMFHVRTDALSQAIALWRFRAGLPGEYLPQIKYSLTLLIT